MNDLIKSIREKNYTQANQLFAESMSTIYAQKLVEMKKMLAARISEGMASGAASIRKVEPKAEPSSSFADGINRRTKAQPEIKTVPVTRDKIGAPMPTIDPSNLRSKNIEKDAKKPFVKDGKIHTYPSQDKAI